MIIDSTTLSRMSSLAYVPELMHDELLYSWLGRLVRLNGLHAKQSSTIAALGFGSSIAIPDLPTNLAVLHAQLSYASPFASHEEMIDCGTIYPYHRPFLTPTRHCEVQSILTIGNGIGLKTLIGRVANGFGANPHLKYCSLCVAEHITHVGHSYWCRQHQLPGVTVCAVHGSTLHICNSTRAIDEFLPVPAENALVTATHNVPSSKWQLEFSILSRDLISANLDAIAPAVRLAVYADEARRRGFTNRKGNVDKVALANALRQHYDDFDGFAFRDRLLSSKSVPLSWIHTMFGRPRNALHPICHLLMIGYLFNTIKSFSEATLRTVSTNAHASALSLPLEVERTQPDEDRAAELLLRDLSLSCRQVAQRLQRSVTTIVSKRRALGLAVSSRRKLVTDDLIEHIKQLLRDGASPAVVARTLSTSVSTVYRVRSEILAELNKREMRESSLVSDRALLVELLTSNPSLGVSEIRGLDSALYARLYRNDRRWMTENMPSRKRGIRSDRVNWDSRDVAFCEIVDQFALRFIRNSDRGQLTYSGMIDQLPASMVRNNLYKLPKLNVLLQAYVETPQAYRKFRVRRAIEKLRRSGMTLTTSAIMRKAAIKSWTPDLDVYLLNNCSLTPPGTPSAFDIIFTHD